MTSFQFTWVELLAVVVNDKVLTSQRIALMVFLIAYALFEVPSNYFLKKLRPSVRVEPHRPLI